MLFVNLGLIKPNTSPNASDLLFEFNNEKQMLPLTIVGLCQVMKLSLLSLHHFYSLLLNPKNGIFVFVYFKV